MVFLGGIMNKINNIEINKKEGYILFSINPEIYPLDVVYSAAYILMDKAYFILDGNPKKKIMVEIRPKKKEDLERLSMNFNEELLNYAVYKTFSEKNKKIRESIIQRALLTNELSTDYLKDPEGIAIPSGGKYGKKKKC